MITEESKEDLSEQTSRASYLTWVGVVALVYVLLIGVSIVGAGFNCLSGGAKWLGTRAAESRNWAFGSIFAGFFVIPGSVFSGELFFKSTEPEIIEAAEQEGSMQCKQAVADCGVMIE